VAKRLLTPSKQTAHEKYVEQVRADGYSASPYRLGQRVGLAGDNLPSPYKPGSRGEYLYLEGMEYGRTERRIDAKARDLYHASTANDPTVHCNRFPAWSELTGQQKWPWREKAIEALANPRGVDVPLKGQQ
jgi:hypothetical protein